MKIMFINTFYYPDIRGGAEISLKKLAEGLVKKGHDVSVLTTSNKESENIINGVHVKRIKINNLYSPIENNDVNKIRKVLYRIIDLYNLFNYSKLKSEIRKINPDIININNIYGFSIIINKVVKALKIPLVVTLRDYYLLCPKVNMLRKGKTCEKESIICKIYRNFNKKIIKDANYVTAPSRFILNKFLNENYFYDKKSCVIYNAIDTNSESKEILKNKISRDQNEVKFIYLGGLEHHKGVEMLINSFKQVKKDNISLYIAGKGSLRDFVKISEINDNRIKYLGFLNENEISKVLAECDVLIAPSLWEEPFGRVIIDAYKYSMPVIATNKGGLDEIVSDNTGIKISDITEKKLMNAIKKLSEENLKTFMINAHEQLNEFTIDNQVEKFENVYKKVLKEKNKIY